MGIIDAASNRKGLMDLVDLSWLTYVFLIITPAEKLRFFGARARFCSASCFFLKSYSVTITCHLALIMGIY